MNFPKVVLLVIFLIIPSYTINKVVAGNSFYIQQEKQERYLHNSRPTTAGINFYVKEYEARIIKEYEDMVKDTLYDVYITVDNIKKYTDDKDVLGYCISGQGSSEIVITNEPRYIQFECSMMSPYQRQTTIEANNFVKGTILHELTHYYYNQVIREMIMDSMFVSPEHRVNLSIIPRKNYGADFVEEGVAVYVTVKKKEIVFGQDFTPESINQLHNKEYKYYVMYNYSCVFVRPILEKYGIKKGMMVIIGNSPPSDEEIMNPTKYYNRLK